MKKFLIIGLGLVSFVSCNLITSSDAKELASLNETLIEINNVFQSKEIVLSKHVKNEVFKTSKDKKFSIITYYDANCSSCFAQLEKWKKVTPQFEKAHTDLNIKFILYSSDTLVTNTNLKKMDFPRSLVVYDEKNDFLEQYTYASNKAYNTMLLNGQNEIVFIGSPLISDNLRKHYDKIIGGAR